MEPITNNSGQSEKAEIAITAEQLISALDAGIRFTSDTQRNEGWSRWAVWGAIAALVWTLIGLLTQSGFSASTAVLLSCGVLGLWEISEEVVRLLSPSLNSVNVKPKFRSVSELVKSDRITMLLLAVKYMLLLAALAHIQPPGVLVLLMYSGIFACLHLSVLASSFSNYTLPSKPKYGRGANFVTWLELAVHVTVLSEVIANIKQSEIDAATIRCALVVNAIMYLLIQLAKSTPATHLLEELFQLRQDFAFARMSLESAASKAKELLEGVRLEETLALPAQNLKLKIEELMGLCAAKSKLMTELGSGLASLDLGKHDQLTDEEHLATLIRQWDRIEDSRSEIQSKHKAVISQYLKFWSGLYLLSYYSEESRAEINTVFHGVRDMMKQAKESVDGCSKQRDELRQQMISVRSAILPPHVT